MPSSCFFASLATLNRLEELGYQRLFLRPGMRFADPEQWWDGRPRPSPHEGTDIQAFIDSDGRVQALPDDCLVPLILAGTVTAIFADFLGATVLVAHERRQGEARLYSLYGHIEPQPGLAVGADYQSGTVLGRIAARRRPAVPPHLHLSALWLSGPLPAAPSWPALNGAGGGRFCDPLALVEPCCPAWQRPVVAGDWQVYLLACADGSLYTGITTDLGRRLAAHNHGRDGARYTRSRRPVRLVYSEPAASRSAAARREWQLKRLPPAAKRELVRGATPPVP